MFWLLSVGDGKKINRKMNGVNYKVHLGQYNYDPAYRSCCLCYFMFIRNKTKTPDGIESVEKVI